MLNDNQPETRTELEASNRALRMSLKKCEALIAECREKLQEARSRLASRGNDNAVSLRNATRR